MTNSIYSLYDVPTDQLIREYKHCTFKFDSTIDDLENILTDEDLFDIGEVKYVEDNDTNKTIYIDLQKQRKENAYRTKEKRSSKKSIF